MDWKEVNKLSTMLKISAEKARMKLYFLKNRYGNRKGLVRLVLCAVSEIVAMQATKELEEAELALENEDG